MRRNRLKVLVILNWTCLLITNIIVLLRALVGVLLILLHLRILTIVHSGNKMLILLLLVSIHIKLVLRLLRLRQKLLLFLVLPMHLILKLIRTYSLIMMHILNLISFSDRTFLTLNISITFDQ